MKDNNTKGEQNKRIGSMNQMQYESKTHEFEYDSNQIW